MKMLKNNLIIPNYDGNGLINLMASIENALGGKSRYSELNLLKSSELNSKNVILLILDGMGYEFFLKNLKKSVMNNYLRGKITSVLSAGTSSAMTTILTGMSPQETGMVGWDVFLRELGTMSDAIPYLSKFSKESLSNYLDINKIYNFNPITNRIKVKSYGILPEEVSKSYYNKILAGKSKIIPYKSIRSMFRKILDKIKQSGKKFILSYTYYPDKLLHVYGGGKIVLREMNKINKELEYFLKRIAKTDTTLIITADHGLRKAEIKFDYKNYPDLEDCLIMPICGEGGLGYCYVKRGKEKKFEKVIKTKFNKYCQIFKSEDFADGGYFGKFKEHKEFRNRIGDYILTFKENHANGSKLDCFEPSSKLGFHGGMTREEMLVPLIVINSKELRLK